MSAIQPPLPPMNVPYAVAQPSVADESHLQVLAICHWVWGGLTCLISCMGLIHVAMGVGMLNGGFGPPMPNGNGNFIPWMFIIMGGAIVLLGWTLGALLIYSGFCLKAQRRWIFSIVVAGIACLSFPVGTVLGVFTIIVLVRPSVKMLYASR